MSALTCSIASRWSGVSVNGNRALEVPLPVRIGPEGVPGAPLSLGVQAQQLPRQLLHGAPGAGLHRLPAGAAELAQRRVLAAGTHVPRDLRELVGGNEHAVVALVFQVQVVARHVRHRARLKAREPRHAVILVHHDVTGAQLGERAQRSPAHHSGPTPRTRGVTAPLGTTTAKQAVLGEHRELQRRRDEALTQRRGRESQRRLEHLPADVDPLAQPRRFQAPEVVGGPLALAAPGKRHHRPVARAHELLELRLGLPQRARRRVRRLGPQLDLLVARQSRQPDPRPRRERVLDALRAHIQVMGIIVSECGAHVAPVIAQHRCELLLGGHHDLCLGADQIKQRAESLDGQQVGDVRPAGRVLTVTGPEGATRRRDLGQLAVLGGELGCRRDLHLLHVPQRALSERREPAQRFDLDVEHVNSHGALLRCREHVQEPSPHRELPPLLDLVCTLIARRHELGRALVEVQQLAHPQLERVRAQLRVGNLLRQRHRADHHDRLLGPGCPIPGSEQGVQRCHAQTDQVRGRSEVGLVGHAS